MQLRWEHIDERIARRVQSHITTAPPLSAPTTRESHANGSGQTTESVASTQAAPLEAVWSVFAASVAFFVVALYGTICFHLTGPLLTVGLLGLPAGIALASWLPGSLAARANAVPPTPSASAKPRAFRHGPVLRGKVGLPADRLRRAFTQAAQTRAEALYGEVVVFLMEPPQKGARHGDKKAARFNRRREETHNLRLLLDECNALLAQSFRLQTEAARIDGLWKNGTALAQINTERFALLQKLDNETDPIVRQSLEESVSLCDERLTSVRAYPTLLARLDAHQEVVCQSLALVSSTLARQQAAPHALHTPDVRGLRHALRTAARQTQAVEAAVLELTPRGDTGGTATNTG